MRRMLRPLSRAESRVLDVRAAEEYGLPTLLLMENAGRGAADILTRWVDSDSGKRDAGVSVKGLLGRLTPGDQPARIIVFCGPGNNGGDGAVMARHLDGQGQQVRVIWSVPIDQLKGDAEFQAAVLQQARIEQGFLSEEDGEEDLEYLASLIAGADWLVDGLFGTGLSRAVGGLAQKLIEMLNRSRRPILALDVPSGLDADTGAVMGVAVKATVTATFVAPKIGFAAEGASIYTGHVEVVEIGLPGVLLEPYQRASKSGQGSSME